MIEILQWMKDNPTVVIAVVLLVLVEVAYYEITHNAKAKNVRG